jgi:putative transposase
MWHGERSIAPVLSYPMSEHHLLAACRYIELNPVRVGLGKEAWSYKWSSAAAHIEGRSDKLVRVGPVVPRQLDANSEQKQNERSRT